MHEEGGSRQQAGGEQELLCFWSRQLVQRASDTKIIACKFIALYNNLLPSLFTPLCLSLLLLLLLQYA